MRSRFLGMMVGTLVVVCSTALPTGTAAAGEVPVLTDASFLQIDDFVEGAQGHPNETHRYAGLKGYVQGRYEYAREQFEQAAFFGDKFSQHYLALMYWHGVGVTADKVRGYVWSDLAAERGNSKLLAVRENMWAGLNATQQARVELLGAEYYVRFGDDEAKPRAEAAMRRFARDMTGSHLGYRNSAISITNSGPIFGSLGTNASNGMLASSAMVAGTTSGDDLYADDRTKADSYWAVQDRMLSGTVTVGALDPR